MGKPNEMRFYTTATDAEPVGPKASHTYRGRPRGALTIDEASRACGWPATALVALHNATYPPQPEDDDDWLYEYAEALYDPEVRDRLAYHAATIGTLTPTQFLICVLDGWDCLDASCKRESLLIAVGAHEQVDGGYGDLCEARKAKAGVE